MNTILLTFILVFSSGSQTLPYCTYMGEGLKSDLEFPRIDVIAPNIILPREVSQISFRSGDKFYKGVPIVRDGVVTGIFSESRITGEFDVYFNVKQSCQPDLDLITTKVGDIPSLIVMVIILVTILISVEAYSRDKSE